MVARKKTLKCWKVSKNDKLWFYVPADKPTPTRPTKRTLNAVKFGNDYDIYSSEGNFSNIKKLKRVNSKDKAKKFMVSYMKKHNTC